MLVAPPADTQKVQPKPTGRGLAYSFLNLPHHEQLAILRELGETELKPDDCTDIEYFTQCFTRIKKRGLLGELAKHVMPPADTREPAESVETAESGLIEQRPQSHTPTCEWWHCGWFVCAADPVKGTIYVGAAFPLTVEQANIVSLCLRRASDWLREALIERGKANAHK
jgi:hypothetical protein